MTKWYEETDQMHDVFVMKRLRLVRNVAGHVFPGRMDEEERSDMLSELEERLLPFMTEDGQPYSYCHINELSDNLRNALYEHRIINYSRVEDQAPSGLALSPDESVSLVLNGEDHLRLQLLSTSQSLENMWDRMDRLDDELGEKVPYAFDSKYGFLTSYMTNVGTGLRASVMVHLPLLSKSRQFRKFVQEYSRFGVTVKALGGDGNENYGSLYEVKNQKTLGQTESELIQLVNNAATQLAGQERRLRSVSMHRQQIQLEDEVYKSYGVLRYAKKLTYKEGMTYLSQLRMGQCASLIALKEPINLFGMMLNIRPANLQTEFGSELKDTDLEEARASYIQARLPELA